MIVKCRHQTIMFLIHLCKWAKIDCERVSGSRTKGLKLKAEKLMIRRHWTNKTSVLSRTWKNLKLWLLIKSFPI